MYSVASHNDVRPSIAVVLGGKPVPRPIDAMLPLFAGVTDTRARGREGPAGDTCRGHVGSDTRQWDSGGGGQAQTDLGLRTAGVEQGRV